MPRLIWLKITVKSWYVAVGPLAFKVAMSELVYAPALNDRSAHVVPDFAGFGVQAIHRAVKTLHDAPHTQPSTHLRCKVLGERLMVGTLHTGTIRGVWSLVPVLPAGQQSDRRLVHTCMAHTPRRAVYVGLDS